MGGYDSDQRGIRGEDGDDIDSAFELFVDTFHDIGGSEPPLHLGWSIDDGETFLDILF